MAKLVEYFFLEEWLRSIISSTSVSLHSSSSAQSIMQAWADLRDSLQHRVFSTHHLQALNILASSQASSLYVADPQAKLLLSILSLQQQQQLYLPEEAYPLFLRLHYIWVRKSRQSSSAVIDSAVEILLHIFSNKQYRSDVNLSREILLLGALSFRSSKFKFDCLELLCKLLEECKLVSSWSDELAANVLAGAGYALSSSESKYFQRILDLLLSIWGCNSISQSLMLLHLIEWVLSNVYSLRSLDKIDQVRDLLESIRPTCSSLTLVMASAGVLRATNRSEASGFLHLKNSAEKCIDSVAKDVVSRTKLGFDPGNDSSPSLLLQCLALALARSGSFSYRPSLLVSLALALLTEAFPLQRIYNKTLNFREENMLVVLDEIKQHLGSIIFKEAGSMTGIFCNQFALADKETQSLVENLIWGYSERVYILHRQAIVMLRGRGDDVILEMEKIAESAFLMVVVFSLGVTKLMLDSRIDQETQLQTRVKILVSFSCIEFFQRIRLPEYVDTIRAVISSVQENESACISFAESIPPYDDLTGTLNLAKTKYLWAADEVQTARVVFYMRVIPTCVDHLPASAFKKLVAPTMFLYMGHPNDKVSRYSHSVFVAFMSSGKDLVSDERTLLKEQLVFYYVQRGLEGYPGVTPFEGLVSGVVALVRHLPAGSPSIFYCIHCLIAKAKSLCSTVSIHNADMWKSWEGELEPPKKLLELLFRLLALVDIQVLPILMKSLAQLIVQLDVEGQHMLLDQLYQQVAESDDVIRKLALVSWLQSLSYVCSRRTVRADAERMGSLSLNGVTARL